MNIDEMPAGHDLDLLIARDVMGMDLPIEYGIRYKDGEERWGQSEEYTRSKCANYVAQGVAECLTSRPYLADWSPSTNIAHAWEIAEKLQIGVLCLGDGLWRAGLQIPALRLHRNVSWWEAADHGGAVLAAEASTAQLAICRVALKANNIKTNETEITP